MIVVLVGEGRVGDGMILVPVGEGRTDAAAVAASAVSVAAAALCTAASVATRSGLLAELPPQLTMSRSATSITVAVDLASIQPLLFSNTRAAR
jgi:hypothetical protein